MDLLLAISFLLGWWLYVPLNKKPYKYVFKTPLDKYVPLIPIFILPYRCYIPMVFITLVLSWNTPFATSFLIAMNIASWSAALFWYLIPNGVIRPKIIEKDVFTRLLNSLYTKDRDTNGFPSGHVLYVSLGGSYLLQLYPQFGNFIIIFSFLVIISTLFTKQHYLVDIPGGLIWAVASRFLAKAITGI